MGVSWARFRRNAGHTYVELLVTTSILLVLASAALPIAAASRRREKEVQLRRALRELRLALDTYHLICRGSNPGTGGGRSPRAGARAGVGPTLTIKVEDDPDRTCYPKDLDLLVEGVDTNVPRYKLRFLRRIPKDPFNTADEEHDRHGWKIVSTTQRPESNAGWDRRNVFDVYSGSEWQALDNSFYKDW